MSGMRREMTAVISQEIKATHTGLFVQPVVQYNNNNNNNTIIQAPHC